VTSCTFTDCDIGTKMLKQQQCLGNSTYLIFIARVEAAASSFRSERSRPRALEPCKPAAPSETADLRALASNVDARNLVDFYGFHGLIMGMKIWEI